MSTNTNSTPDERRLAAQTGAYISWGRTTDRTARTAPGRAALDQKFLDQADGDPKRAEALRKAYFADLTRRSIAARRKAKEHTRVAERTEQEIAEAGGAA